MLMVRPIAFAASAAFLIAAPASAEDARSSSPAVAASASVAATVEAASTTPASSASSAETPAKPRRAGRVTSCRCGAGPAAETEATRQN